MDFLIRIVIVIVVALLAIVVLIALGLRVQPQSFPAYAQRTPSVATTPLPPGLPAPVERFYRTVYGDQAPLITSAVFSGRAVIRPVMNIPLPARFIFVHEAGKGYRHYFEATLFGRPFLTVNEGYVDGKSFFESPMANLQDDPNTNQGANLALWAEASWFPSLWVTDKRARWQAVDDHTALLYVPFEDKEESFVVRFNPQTNLIDVMKAMRYREAGADKPKILWITRSEPGKPIPGTPLSTTGSATWLDQGKPWAVFTLEDTVFNVDVSTYLRQRGQ